MPSTSQPVFVTYDAHDDIHDAVFAKKGCCFSAAGSVWWERIKTVDCGNREPHERWWIRGWRKLREFSELVVGPKWKTFIRRLSRNPNCFCGGRGGGGDWFTFGGGRGQGKFRYDPCSYALNFDEGRHNHHYDEGLALRDFSSRYASLPSSAKCSMDLGKDAPLFT
ncbi:uncharacterized protein LOC110808501 [Carica papaya]|uniref:uncharacterized protein LOC110808501 n=1 Tax=Carica papaya TaxID=3649 RepID=UPI000B8CBCB5|nr:uncharacterized protein LOC110808501 [Carica papaya]